MCLAGKAVQYVYIFHILYKIYRSTYTVHKILNNNVEKKLKCNLIFFAMLHFYIVERKFIMLAVGILLIQKGFFFKI